MQVTITEDEFIDYTTEIVREMMEKTNDPKVVTLITMTAAKLFGKMAKENKEEK